MASKWEIYWAALNNIGGGIQLHLPPLPPLFLANLSASVCARCSDGNFYHVRHVEGSGSRLAWDSVLRRLSPDDDAFYNLGCEDFVFAALPSRAHAVPAALEFAPRASGAKDSSLHDSWHACAGVWSSRV